MTASPGRDGAGQAETADGWRDSLPELVLTAVFVLAVTGAIYLFAGTGAAVAAVIGWAVLLLLLLRMIVPATAAPLAQQHPWRAGAHSSFTGFWRKRGVLTDATASMSSYDAELRPTLQHLLAARLAERHGVSLYQDPDTARRLFLPTASQDALWFWLDPARPALTEQNKQGIPPRTLAAIIDRLERL